MATLTLRNVPDDLAARLKARARRHRGSLNNETIAALELAGAAAAQGREIPQLPPVPLLTPEEVAEQRAHFESFRSRFRGRAIPDEELVAAVERDSHPPDSDHFGLHQRGLE